MIDVKSGVAAGAVAGVVAGIVGAVLVFIEVALGLEPSPPVPMEYVLAALIGLTTVFGAVFGALYARFYDPMPGTGVMKGVYFGLLVWLIKDVAAGAYVVLMGEIPTATGLIFGGFFLWIVYGPVLGVLYKK